MLRYVWECINSQSRHSHSRRSTSRTQLRITDRRSIRQSKTLNDGRSPIIDAPQPSIIQSAQRLTLFRSAREYASTNHISPNPLLNQSDFPTSVDLRECSRRRVPEMIIHRLFNLVLIACQGRRVACGFVFSLNGLRISPLTSLQIFSESLLSHIFSYSSQALVCLSP